MSPGLRHGRALAGELIRLFVRRLIDNDVLSPYTDRRESLAMTGGLLISLGLFATFFVCLPYLTAFLPLPAVVALSALPDRFLFVAAAMTIGALTALLVWDGLALDARDAAILGPLPIALRTITTAKLAAALAFGSTATVCLNAVPSLLYPTFLTVNIRGLEGVTLVRLVAAHAVTTMSGGMLGFMAMLAVRSTVRLILGERGYQQVSNGVQSVLVVGVVAALLLAPTVEPQEVRRWLGAGGGAAAPAARPVLWHLGLNDTLAGHRLPDTPVLMPAGLEAVTAATAANDAARAEYHALLPRLATLARHAVVLLVIVVATALATFAWTNRRLPERVAAATRASLAGTALRVLFARRLRDAPDEEAGFFFTVQTLARSRPHRTIVALAAGVGLTHAWLVLRNLPAPATLASISQMAGATGLLACLLSGIRYAVAVPATPAANWTVRLAWRGDNRRFVAGVKRAAAVVGTLVLVLLLPRHVVLLGLTGALMHTALVALFGAAGLETLFLTCRRLPFASTSVPLQNPKLQWPAGLAGLLVVTYGFATAERWAMLDRPRLIGFAVALTGVVLVLRAMDRRRDPVVPRAGDERPGLQRLGLADHIMGFE